MADKYHIRSDLKVVGDSIELGVGSSLATVALSGGDFSLTDPNNSLIDLKDRIIRASESANNLTSDADGKVVGAHYDSGTGKVDFRLMTTAGTVTKVVKCERATLVYNTSSPFNIGSVLPTNAIVTKAIVNVTVAFNGATPTLTLGITGTPSGISVAGDVKLKIIGLYNITTVFSMVSGGQIIGTYTASGSTAGAATVLIEYHTV